MYAEIATEWIANCQPYCAERWYMSETDAALSPIVLPTEGIDSLHTEGLRAALHISPDTPIQTLRAEDWFNRLAEEHDYYADNEIANARGFAALYTWLQTQVADLAVWRVGQIEIDIYVLGRLPSGYWAGVQTMAVET